MSTTPSPIGELIREWRMRRRMSQLDLAGEAEISQRHLSFLESGRAAPSRDMVHPAGRAAGDSAAPAQPAAAGGRLCAELWREPARRCLASRRPWRRCGMVLKGHEPNPALAVDRHWNLVAANARARRRCSPVSPTPRCLSRRSMCCASACIRQASRRASSISRNGGRICWSGCGARTKPLPIPRWRNWSASCAPIRAASRRRRPHPQ